MGPEALRKRVGIASFGAAPVSLLACAPALAQSAQGSVMGGIAPLAVAFGAGGFALIATLVVRTLLLDAQATRRKARDQVASLRALVDEYEALLSGTREVTILWPEASSAPKFLGQTSAVIPAGRRPESILDFSSWLPEADAKMLDRALQGLRGGASAFDLSLRARDGRTIRATGWVLGGGAALRVRPAFLQPEILPASDAATLPDRHCAEILLRSCGVPAFIRDESSRLVFANGPYQALAERLGKPATGTAPREVLEGESLKAHLDAVPGGEAKRADLGKAGTFELIDLPIEGGRVGYLRPLQAAPAPASEAGAQSHINGIIDALATPIAIFGPKRELVQFNRAYAALWGLDREWLRLGMDEKLILDRLRTDGLLPAESNYKGWRDKHLQSYERKLPRENEPWHLPDGRTLKVISAPASPKGGVIYVFEDISARLDLESRNRALSSVQRETLNALSEGVAVFGTNGKLTLFNPRLSTLWKVPTNELSLHPHIDKIAELSAQALPEDGASIWRDLKRGIVDLNPTRRDTTGRIARADGRLLDYAITRLPDGQTMMTFLDVTESANYSRVLRERNEALVTADVLKDAFVQNVSYELRSPLTNIIGFADILASGEAGALNERQRAYTDYIRASSTTLGVLIDNILDLATVNAGMTELNPAPQDIPALVEQARAGLAASFPEVDGEKGLNLVVSIAPDLPSFIADGTRIVQILYNLLSSAARFSRRGDEIRLTVEARAERVLFIVEDEGTGLSEEAKAALLERGDSLASSGRQRGAGLGLAIVRSFVNLHGGTIMHERREPRGTRVIVNLPRDASLSGAAE